MKPSPTFRVLSSTSRKSSGFLLPALTLLAGLALTASSASAANVIKANNVDNLDLGTSWVGGVPPTSSDVGVWDGTVTAANTVSLNTDTNWLGLRILNPVGLVTINAGNTLTLGASGLDMSFATQNLSLGCGLNLSANQTWNVTNGQALFTSGLIAGSGTLLRTGGGTWSNNIAGSSYTAGTILAGGTSAVGVVGNGGWGTGSITITNSAVLALFSSGTGDPGGGGGSFTNALVIPAGMTGSMLGMWRGTVSSPLTGGGTFNLRINGTRGEYTGNWSAYTGQINVTSRTGTTDDWRVNIGGITSTFLLNSKVNLGVGVNLYQSANPPNGGASASTTSQQIGELSGVAGSFLLGNPVGGRFVDWNVGFLNTDARFDGVIGNSAGASRFTKVGTGTWTLSGNNVFTGSSQVSTGRVLGVTGGGIIGSASITIRPSAAFGVLAEPAAAQWTGTNMIFSSGSTNEFNFAGSVPSTTTALMKVNGNLCYSNTTTIKVTGGNWALGTYPLAKYNTLTNGAGFAGLTLAPLPSGVLGFLSNDVANTQIVLWVTNSLQPLSWATGNGTWDTSTLNWVNNASVSTNYAEAGGFGSSVQFEDTFSGSSPITVTLNTAVVPVGVKAKGAKNYTISGTGSIGGVASLTKSGSGTLTLSTTNSFTGGANLNGGVVNFSTLANLGASSSPIFFGGGTLQYNGNTDDISVRTVTLNSGGAIIDTAGSSASYAKPIGNNGAGGLTKIGNGTLTLNGTNRYTGNTIVGGGTLALGSVNTYLTNSPSIAVSNGAILTATASGLNLASMAGQILAGAGTVNGGVTNGTGTTISPGFGPGTLTLGNDLAVNGGTLVFDVSTNSSDKDLLVVGGALSLNSGTVQIVASTLLTNGTYKLIQQGSLVGSVANVTLTGFSQANKLGLLSSATVGEIDLVVKSQASDNEVWTGNANNFWDEEISLNWTTNAGVNQSVFIDGDLVTFNDTGAAQPSVALYAAVLPSSVVVSNVAVTTYTFTDGAGGGAGKISGGTGLTKAGSGTLLIDTINNNSGPTVIKAGTVQVGDGSSTGDIGTGNITNNGVLVFQQTDNRSVVGVVSGTGSLTQNGATTLTLTGTNTYSGRTAVNQGSILQVGNNGATGTVGSGAGTVTNAGTIVVNRTGSITITNGISGSQSGGGLAALTKAASGTLTLGGVNTYEGNTSISGGVLKLNASEVIPDGGTTTGWLILDGGASAAGILDLNGFNETVNALSGLTGTVVGQIVNNAVGTTNTLVTSQIAATTYAGLIKDNSGSGGVVALVKNGANALTLNNVNTYSGGTTVNGGQLNVFLGTSAGSGAVTMGDGTILNMSQGGSPSQFPGFNVITKTNAIATFTSANLANAWGGLFSCTDATSTNLFPVTGSGSSIGGSDVYSFGNFLGTVQLDAAGTIRFLGNPNTYNGGPNTRFVINGALNSRNGMTLYLGELSGSGALNGAGSPGTNAQRSTFIIGSKGTDSQYDGSINGTVLSTTRIVKTGVGKLVLNGSLAYDGSTTVSNGVLVLATDATTLGSSFLIDLESTNAVLDVSGYSSQTLTLGGSQVLTGFGTVYGSVNSPSGTAVTVGLGTLRATNVFTLNGALNMQLNRTNAANCSKLTASGGVVNASALTITNAGPALVAGDTFQLFSGATTGFTATNLPALGVGVAWTNKLAINGSIAVVATVSLVPTNITTVVNGGNIELSWPADHTGWSLQVQTNTLAVGLITNLASWVTIPGTAALNSYTNAINPANGSVFYRMVYP